MTRPNRVFFALAAAFGITVLAAALLAAEAHGKRRRDRAWLREAGAR